MIADYNIEILLVAILCSSGLPQNVFAPGITSVAAAVLFEPSSKDVDRLAAGAATAYFLVAGPVGAACGALADRLPRRLLLLCCLACSCTGSVLATVATREPLFLLARALQGAAAGAVLPTAYSAIGDLVTGPRRPSTAATAGIFVGVGAAVGQLVTGVVGGQHWRPVAAVLAIMDAAVLGLVLMAWPEPQREGGGTSKPPGQPAYAGLADTLHTMAGVLAVPTNRRVLAQGLAGTLPWTCISLFLPPFLMHGLSSPTATGLMLVFGVAGLVGGWLGGRLGTALYGQPGGSSTLPTVVGIAQAMGGLPMFALLQLHASMFDCPAGSAQCPPGGVPLSGWLGMGLLAALGGLTASIAGPNLRAMLLNANPPESRASAFSVGQLADAVSKGVAPQIITVLLAGEAGKGQHSSRAWTLGTIMVCGWLASGIIIASASRTLPQDELSARGGQGSGVPAHPSGSSDTSPREQVASDGRRRRKGQSNGT